MFGGLFSEAKKKKKKVQESPLPYTGTTVIT